MEKALFTITCTTCQARLAVRSEAAIGAILECPKCQSMVQVTPPEGWNAPPASEAAGVPGPPPLDRIQAGSLTVDLEPVDRSLAGLLSRHFWLVWVGFAAVTLVVVAVLWKALMPTRTSPPVRPPVEQSAATPKAPAPKPSLSALNLEPAAPNVEQEKTPSPAKPAVHEKRHETAVAGKTPPAAASPSKPQSGGVSKNPSPSKALPSKALPPKTSPPKTPTTTPAVEKKVEKKKVRPIDVKKLAPPRVDVAARLADRLPSVHFTDLAFAKAVDLLVSMSTVPVTLDIDAMTRLGVSPRDPISLKLDDTTVGDAMKAIAAERGMTLVVNNDQTILTSPDEDRETLKKVRYRIDDLVGDDRAAPDRLAAMVQKLVAPRSWHAAGGRGTIEPAQDALTIQQTADVHHQVLTFCEKLRVARQKPLRSREPAERFSLVPRRDQAATMLDARVTANFHAPTSLAKVAAFLAAAAEGDIVIDRAALAAAATCDGVEASFVARKDRLGDAMASLVRPLGLTYRVVGPTVLQITTPEAARQRLDLEFYPVGPWLDKGTTAAALVDRLKAEAKGFAGDDRERCEIQFDPPSRHVLVLCPQATQAAIEKFLNSPPRRLETAATK